MRTTINIPDNLKQKLVIEATSRKIKGYSQIIIEALNCYFDNQIEDRKATICRLKGSLTKEEYEDEQRKLKEGRKNWKI